MVDKQVVDILLILLTDKSSETNDDNIILTAPVIDGSAVDDIHNQAVSNIRLMKRSVEFIHWAVGKIKNRLHQRDDSFLRLISAEATTRNSPSLSTAPTTFSPQFLPPQTSV
ncbi:hypothetical protein PIB30_087258 [Stylosanthes scabra]|uniref:Uncharacterized protein n=1 Tax=Stylosanthes scabra TaxID=79078 RepID=A0ABU6YSC4_9FABA|nr:hypothetical protein [Stylosanthes scabra]